MRLITWNCQGGFHRKAEAIETLQPHLAIIQERECPDRLRSRTTASRARPIVWCGDSPTKGLAVISFTDAQLEVDRAHDSSLKHLLPVVVIGYHISGRSRWASMQIGATWSDHCPMVFELDLGRKSGPSHQMRQHMNQIRARVRSIGPSELLGYTTFEQGRITPC